MAPLLPQTVQRVRRSGAACRLPTVAFFATLFHRIQTQTSGVEVNFRAITLLLAIFLAFAQPAAARTGRGALGGAAGGALIGGLAGGGRGAAIGALVGAGTGALIAREGRRHGGRHYWWHGNCYYHGRSGRWYRVSRRYC